MSENKSILQLLSLLELDQVIEQFEGEVMGNNLHLDCGCPPYRNDEFDISSRLDKQMNRIDILNEEIFNMKKHRIGADWFIAVKRGLFLVVVALIMLIVFLVGVVEQYDNELDDIKYKLDMIEYRLKK